MIPKSRVGPTAGPAFGAFMSNCERRGGTTETGKVRIGRTHAPIVGIRQGLSVGKDMN